MLLLDAQAHDHHMVIGDDLLHEFELLSKPERRIEKENVKKQNLPSTIKFESFTFPHCRNL